LSQAHDSKKDSVLQSGLGWGYFWQWRQKLVMRWAEVISVSGFRHEGVGQG